MGYGVKESETNTRRLKDFRRPLEEVPSVGVSVIHVLFWPCLVDPSLPK